MYMVIRERPADKTRRPADYATASNRYETVELAVESASMLAHKYGEPYIVLHAVHRIKTEAPPVVVENLS